MRNLIIIFSMIIFSIPLKSAERMRIAVIDLKANNVSKTTSRAVSDLIRADLVDSGMFTVVERGQMNEILKEQTLQQTGCTDNTCAVEVGKLLSANKILIGEMSKIGKTLIITIRIVDVEKGAAEFSSVERAKSMDALESSVSRLIKRLIDTIGGKTITKYAGYLETPENVTATENLYKNKIVIKWSPVKEADKYYIFKSRKKDGKYQLVGTVKSTTFTDRNAKEGKNYYYKVRSSLYTRFSDFSDPVPGMSGHSKTGYYLRGLIPGWGQSYYGNKTKGYIMLGGFIALSAGLGYSAYNYIDKKDAYDSLPFYTSKSEFDSKYDDYKSAANTGIFAAGIWALYYIYNWIDLAWISKPTYKDDTESAGSVVYPNFKVSSRLLLSGKRETRALLSANIRF